MANMTIELPLKRGGDGKWVKKFSQDSMAVATAADQQSNEIVLAGLYTRLAVRLFNQDGGGTLDQCSVRAKFHSDSGDALDWVTNADMAAGTPIPGRLVAVQVDPTTLVADSYAAFILDVTGLYSVHLRLSASGSAATVDIVATAS